MHPRLEAVRDRSFLLSTAHYLAGQLLFRAGLRGHRSGATFDLQGLDGTRGYARRVCDDYLHYGGLKPSDLAGARVLEVGPGDNVAVALLLAAYGAERVVCLDRFQGASDPRKNAPLYRAVVASLPEGPRRRGAACLTAAGDVRPEVVDYRHGFPVEQAHEHLPKGSFDLIVSRAVLEHVYDVEGAWRSMDALLAPGGRMLHKVDLRCHSLYERLHPLWFLTVPGWLWRLASSPDPTLNRARRPVYVKLAEEAGYACEVLVTHIASRSEEFVPHRARLVPGEDFSAEDAALVERIRPRLPRALRGLPTEDLLVTGIFLHARKPSGSSAALADS